MIWCEGKWSNSNTNISKVNKFQIVEVGVIVEREKRKIRRQIELEMSSEH